MVGITVASEYLNSGLSREVELYEGAWTAKDVVTNLGSIEGSTNSPVGYYATPLHKGEMVKKYTGDDNYRQMEASDDGNLVKGFLVDAPHGNVGSYRRGVVYFFGVGDIVLLDCDITHTAIAIDSPIDIDAVNLSGTNKHGVTADLTGGTGFGKSLNVLAINTIGAIAVQVTAVN